MLNNSSGCVAPQAGSSPFTLRLALSGRRVHGTRMTVAQAVEQVTLWKRANLSVAPFSEWLLSRLASFCEGADRRAKTTCGCTLVGFLVGRCDARNAAQVAQALRDLGRPRRRLCARVYKLQSVESS
jgi:hypothetical protein